ncbi:hypothetical protein CDD83_5485 [Cordyceps sp. RAO-2017]|nr:hypothetical protein CDD83_5485 [Cordyceps sp. RAO-2017]
MPTSASPQPPPLASPSPPPPAATVELEATFDVVPTPPSESLELRGPPRQPSLEEASHAGSVARSPNPPISAQLPQTASPDEAPDAVSTSLAAPPPAESAEPPTAAPAPAPAFVRHSSPKTTDTRLDTSWEYRQLSDLIQCMPASVVRQVVRDQSDRCLLGSEYHHGFVIKKALRQATWPMLDSAAQEVGEQLARISRPHIMAHVTSQDLDELADAVLAKASNKFLDKGMARRLETIRARQLVNALARAERLGYDVRDIVEEKTAYGAEHVVPSPGALPAMGMPPQAMQTPPAVTLASQPMQSQPMQSQQHQASSQAAARHPAPAAAPNQHGILHCAACSRPCSGEQALRYHTARRACDHSHKVHRVGKDLCQHCGCLFTSNGGLAYHVKSKVCGDYSEATEKAVLAELYAQHWHTSPPRDMMPGSPAQPRPAGTPGQHKMAGTPGQHTMTITPQHKTPGQMVAAAVNPGSVSSRPTPGHTPNGTSSHPYANLTPEARRNFEHEMQQAEEKYGALMRNALMLPDKAKQEEELTRLKNSYNTKQSVTRKKSGTGSSGRTAAATDTARRRRGRG